MAISNNRLLHSEDGHVTFRWKDYREGDAQKTMTLTVEEFIRRFLLHVLPTGFQRIRYYGFLGNRYREEKLAQCRSLLQVNGTKPQSAETEATPVDYRARHEALTGVSLQSCPVCHRGRMVVSEQLSPCRAPEPTLILDTS